MSMVRNLLLEVRRAARSLAADRAFTSVALLSLALGIGVTASVFSVLNALVLRPLPGIVGEERLVTLGVSYRDEAARPRQRAVLTRTELEAVEASPGPLRQIAAAARVQLAADAGGGPFLVDAEAVTPEYFSVLGTTPAEGRLLTPASAAAGEIVVSEPLARARYGGVAEAPGRTLVLGGRRFVVVGVAQRGFSGLTTGAQLEGEPGAPSVWLPLESASSLLSPVDGTAETDAVLALHVLGRTEAGRSRDLPEAAFVPAARRIEATAGGAMRDVELVTGDLRFGPGAGRWRPTVTLAAFLVVPVLVLLVACANVASLLLVRGVRRRHELAVRAALGAGRLQLIRQLSVENLVLALAGAGGGLLLATVGRHLPPLLSIQVPVDVPLDGTVLLFTTAVAVVASVAFGLLPALAASDTDLGATLGGGRSKSGRRTGRLQGVLIVTQVVVVLVLLAVAGLFVRSGARGGVLPLGIDDERLVEARLTPALAGRAGTPEFWALASAEVESLPGVEAVSVAPSGTLDGLPYARVRTAEDRPPLAVPVARVDERFFTTVGLDLHAGRGFGRSAGEVGDRETVVSASLAARLWPAESPLGRTLWLDEPDGSERLVVVGLAADRRVWLTEPPGPMLYLRRAPALERGVLLIRAHGRAADVLESVRAGLERVLPEVPIEALHTARDARRAALLPWRLSAAGLAILGSIALVLAAVGLYAVVADTVTSRTAEIGVRMSLGASPVHIMRMVVLRALGLVGTGVALGAGLAAALALLLRSALFDLAPLDLLSFGGAALLLLAVTAAAAVLPARQAAAIDPATALTGSTPHPPVECVQLHRTPGR